METVNQSQGHLMSIAPLPPGGTTARQALVLIAEDEPEIAEILQAYGCQMAMPQSVFTSANLRFD